ncbi:MAG: BMP family ABC transporter substrate-binding protein, partial [Acidimicrobiia bacterium]|nr:BMP family ABC transporter substrate-binding protein [Acidimicrobiia bacterium]
DIQAGTFAEGGTADYYQVGVADEGLIVAINDGLSDRISADAMTLYEERLAEIKAGEFTVPFIAE